MIGVNPDLMVIGVNPDPGVLETRHHAGGDLGVGMLFMYHGQW